MKKNLTATVMLVILATFGVTYGLHQFHELGVAHAQSAGSAMLDAGAAAGPAAPAPQLVDPTVDLAGFWAELKALKSTGWTVLVLLVAYGLLKSLGALAPKWSFLQPLTQGRAAIAWAGALSIVTAAFAAVTHMGTWAAVGSAAISAVLAFINFHAPANA